MFSVLSNAPFNNGVFSPKTMLAMPKREIHPSAARLYEAAKLLKKTEGKSAVAVLLDELPQNMTNWENRGVSSQGALKAQTVIGCSALWISTGEGSMTERPLSPEVAKLAASIDAIQDTDAREVAMQGLRTAVRAGQIVAAANERNPSRGTDDGHSESTKREAAGAQRRRRL